MKIMMKCDKLKRFSIIFTILIILSISTSWAAVLRIEGSVIDIDHGRRTIKVKTGKSLETLFKYNNKTRFLSNSIKISPFSIIPGDHIKASISGRGEAESINVNGNYYAGEVIFINKDKMLTAEEKQVYFSPDVKFYVNGVKSQWKDIPTGCRIYARVDPGTELAGSVYAVDFKKQVGKSGNFSSKIWKVDIRGKKSYRKNDILKVIVKASGKKKVSMDIPGIAGRIPLKEIKPGIYGGNYKFTRNNIRRTYIVVHISDKKGYAYRICPSSINVAISGAEIIPVYPHENETIREKSPSIFVRFIPGGSLVKANSTGVIIDGKSLKSGMDRNVGFVSCKLPSLKPGKHSIKIVVSDDAGNWKSKKWYFYVR
ncbi:MAG: hypothetical protein K8T10_12100 [Candidatus Eremiobacteraeota bacterium]|nr:hypothetical protein [Candidatus Eremiobacteraeota bacterium]